MRWLIIGLAVVGLAFVAFMLLGSNEEQPQGEPTEYEPPSVLEWLARDDGAPRLVSSEIRFPRDGGDRLGLAVPEACGTPARIATFVLREGTNVRISYECDSQPREADCSGPASLCRQEVCLVRTQGEGSRCPADRTKAGEADLSLGPERGRIVVSPPPNGVVDVVLH